ncbi:hypothetical protein Tco_0676220 [Tanacetum coccineum]
MGDFVSVRSEGTKTRTTSRGGLGVRRVRGGLGVRRGRGGLGVSRGRGGVRVSRGRDGQTVRLGVRRVTSEGIPATRMGKGGQTLGERYDRLGRWFGLVDETQKETLLVTQQSQEGIQQQPQAAEERSQAQVGVQQEQPAAEEGRQAQANRNIERGNQNLRPRSARIMKNRLSRSVDGIGSSNTNAQDLD